ncbi:hypothetical protein RCL1_004753 [Eukaryota sp. TZLM3-RCL]
MSSNPSSLEDNSTSHEYVPFSLDFSFPLKLIREGINVVVDDQFSKCFASRPPQTWNYTYYLFVLWVLGVFIRYFILFPIRLAILIIGIIIVVTLFVVVSFFPDGEWKQVYLSQILRFLTHIMILSWTGVVKYHGTLPRHRPNQIYVANHTTMLDLVLLCQQRAFTVVGQQHGGWIGFIQNTFLASLGCIWFERTDYEDRQVVARRIKRHLCDPYALPLLIFPEGTCVANDYVVQFKKGAFELGCSVVPIAIKYNNIFVDGFWNSKQQSFLSHVLSMMVAWAVVADVYYMEPTSIRPSETSADFAERVRDLIAKQAGLTAMPFDGYLKFTAPSEKLVADKRAKICKELIRRAPKVVFCPITTEHPDPSPPVSPVLLPAALLEPRLRCRASSLPALKGSLLEESVRYFNGKVGTSIWISPSPCLESQEDEGCKQY